MGNSKSTSGKISTAGDENTKGQIIINLGAEKILKLILSFFLHYATVFSSMHPLGIGFFSAVFSKESWLILLSFSLFGSIISGAGILYSVTLCAVTCVFVLWDKFEEIAKYRAVATSIIYFIFSLIKITAEGIIAYDILASALESVIAGTAAYVFSKGGKILLSIKKRSIISESETMHAYASIALIVFSLNAIGEVWGFRISSVAAMVIIFSMSYSGEGMGAMYLSILLGVIGATQNPGQSAITSAYAFGSLLSYRLKNYGKTGVVLGFVISNTAFSLFLTETHTIVLNLYDCFVASVIFFLLPDSVTSYFEFLSKKSTGKILNEKLSSPDAAVTRKLNAMADSFAQLSDIYKKLYMESDKRHNSIKYPIKELKTNVCIACPEKERCFSKNGPAIKTLEKISNPGKISASSLPGPLTSVCHRCDSFAKILKEHYDKIKSDIMWSHKLNECKNLIARQLSGISESLKKNSAEMCAKRDEKAEEKLWSVFDDAQICPCMIYAEEKMGGEYDIEIYFDEKDVTKETKTLSMNLVGKALEKNVEFAGTRREKNKVVFVFYPQRGYSASFGYATKPKHGEKVCGDSFNVVYTQRDKMVMVLSDGMGSGEDAAIQSRETVSLMEKFLRCGFECELCAELINSSLILKGEKESFATLDLCVVDLSLSSLSFMKSGAASSYIKSDGKIFPVRAGSLPAGILTETEPKKHMLSFETDTVVVLMSDGVADISLKNPEAEGWIEKELEKISPGTNPQIIARRILDKATALTGCTGDDMTVVTACILKV